MSNIRKFPITSTRTVHKKWLSGSLRFLVFLVAFSFCFSSASVPFANILPQKEHPVKKTAKKKDNSRKPVTFFRPIQQLEHFKVKLSHQPGVYNSPVSLKFELPAGTEIFYIKNNRDSAKRIKYTAPIKIDTVLNLQCWIKVNGRILDTMYCGTYIMPAKHTLPVLSLTVVPASFFSPTGIYDGYREYHGDTSWTDYGNCWKKNEIDCYAEFFYNNKLVEYGAYGIKTHGGFTLALPEKSLQLIADKNYGSKYLNYKFFPDKPFNEYKSLVIRTSGGDQNGTRFKDVLISSVAKDLGIDYMAYQPAVLYVNGIYWGIHNLREKVNKNYLKYNHGADPDSTILLELSGLYNKTYESLINYAVSKNQSPDFPVNIEKKMDVDQYFNFSILQIFNANVDSRGNIKFWKADNTDDRFHWIFYDGDASAGTGFLKGNFLAQRLSPNQTEWYNPSFATILLRSLIANPELKNRFINQYCLLLSTYLSADSLSQRVTYFKTMMEPEIPRHVKRRNNIWNESVKSWNRQVESFRYFYLHMPARALEQLKMQFGLGDTTKILITTNIPGLNTLKVNDSKLRFRKVNGYFFVNIPLKIEATSENHLYRFSQWKEDGDTSPSKKVRISKKMKYTAEYTLKESSKTAGKLMITRFYATMQTKHDLEWLEIRNVTDDTLGMGGFTIYEDMNQWSHQFSNIVLKPNRSVVLCSDSIHFREINPDFPGVLIQSKLEEVFRQHYQFVLCDGTDKLVDQFRVDFPDSLLCKKNHFLVTKKSSGPEYLVWNNDKNKIDWSKEVCQQPEGEGFSLKGGVLYWIGGVLGAAAIFALIFLLLRKAQKKSKINDLANLL